MHDETVLDSLHHVTRPQKCRLCLSNKCKHFVVMDRETYVSKEKFILDDPDAYEKLKRDPPKQVEEMTQLRRKVNDDRATVPSRWLFGVSRHSRCAEWYGLPKDHKPFIPLRPIISKSLMVVRENPTPAP